MFLYFTQKELLAPEKCPVKDWNKLPSIVKANMEHTLSLLNEIRRFIKKPIFITSTYRPHSNGSAHKLGKAIDFQFKNDNGLYIKTMEYLGTKSNPNDFRAILEWNFKDNWIHLDRNFRKSTHNIKIAYPKVSGMVYEKYQNILPQDKYKLA